jgi:GTPase Era involved in 16S rRNA processing
VFLDLRVKVKPDWRDDEKVLDELGLPKKRSF